LKGIIQHFGNNPFEYEARRFQTRISINLNQPGPKGLINHKIQAKYLKDPPTTTKFATSSLHGINGHGPHLLINLIKLIFLSTPIGEVLPKDVIINFIAILVFAVLLAVLLDGVVG
jgi:hypothetical protein